MLARAVGATLHARDDPLGLGLGGGFPGGDFDAEEEDMIATFL